MKPRDWSIALAVSLTFASIPAAVFSKCGTGNPPSYNDITAIMFTQNGCKNTIQDADAATLRSQQFPKGWSASTFDCSTFWVLFWWSEPARFPATYSQYNLKDAVGTYHLSATLANATELLRSDDFFALSPSDMIVTDTARSVLSVRRCAVVTRISIYNTPSPWQDVQTLRLFSDLRALVMRSRATRISSSPRDFDENGLFDP
jgi:hypothetical protein